MGKKIFRKKKSIAPLKKSPQQQIAEIVGDSLDAKKAKVLGKALSKFNVEKGESIDDAINRLWDDADFTMLDEDGFDKKYAALRKLRRMAHSINKEEILNQIKSNLQPQTDESADEMVTRLLGRDGNGISNKKLLKLKKISDRMENEFGGSKDKLVDALMDARRGEGGKVDETYRTHLNKKSLGTLLMTYDHKRQEGLID